MTIEVVRHVLYLRIRGQHLDSRWEILYSRPHLILPRRSVAVGHHRQGGQAVFAASAAISGFIARALTALRRKSVAGGNPSHQRSHLSLRFRRQAQRRVDLRNGSHGSTRAVVVATAAAAAVIVAVVIVVVDDGGGGGAGAAVISLLFAAFVSR